jgi:hypothetical protein
MWLFHFSLFMYCCHLHSRNYAWSWIENSPKMVQIKYSLWPTSGTEHSWEWPIYTTDRFWTEQSSSPIFIWLLAFTSFVLVWVNQPWTKILCVFQITRNITKITNDEMNTRIYNDIFLLWKEAIVRLYRWSDNKWPYVANSEISQKFAQDNASRQVTR